MLYVLRYTHTHTHYNTQDGNNSGIDGHNNSASTGVSDDTVLNINDNDNTDSVNTKHGMKDTLMAVDEQYAGIDENTITKESTSKDKVT
jgi:hypothetical protein